MMLRFFAFIVISLAIMPAMAATTTSQALAHKQAGTPVTADNWMISAANPLAVEAGAHILRNGGTAADAMVAVQSVLGLVEPQSSGLGGGAFLVWYDGKTGSITTLDGRETAPMAVTPQLFQDKTGAPLKFFDAVVGGLSVGTPGTPALLQAAHERWGRSPWSSLFDDAISLASDGFDVSARLASLIAGDKDRLARYQPTADYFLPSGIPLQAGDRLKNPAYAKTLHTLAMTGVSSFYRGAIAADIVDTARSPDTNPGLLSAQDLSIYRIKERPAICTSYRGYDVCGMGPPSSGGLTVGQILGLLEPFDLAALGPQSADAWRLIGDASRLAFADRGRYMADSDYVPVPTRGLLDSDYLAERSALLDGSMALNDVDPGNPPFDTALNWSDDESNALPSTSHISIIDPFGNALSMTTTIENAFGSRLMTQSGFLLNNELTDFSFRSHRNGIPIANRVEPGKRPRSSMAPTIVLKDGSVMLVAGSPGGSRIIGYVAKTIIGVLDWGLDAQQSVDLPHLVNRFGVYDLEAGTSASNLSASLTAFGYKVKVRGLNSGLHIIVKQDGTYFGGADNRREGIALGE